MKISKIYFAIASGAPIPSSFRCESLFDEKIKDWDQYSVTESQYGVLVARDGQTWLYPWSQIVRVEYAKEDVKPKGLAKSKAPDIQPGARGF